MNLRTFTFHWQLLVKKKPASRKISFLPWKSHIHATSPRPLLVKNYNGYRILEWFTASQTLPIPPNNLQHGGRSEKFLFSQNSKGARKPPCCTTPDNSVRPGVPHWSPLPSASHIPSPPPSASHIPLTKFRVCNSSRYFPVHYDIGM